MQNTDTPQGRVCAIQNCESSVKCRGFCGKHYQRIIRLGSAHLPKMTKPIAWLHANKTRHERECFFWPFGSKDNGYGQVYLKPGVKGVASREMCKLAHGEPPTPSHEAAHSCANGHLGCVNPDHLRWATHADNVADMVAHGNSAFGEKNPSAQLKEADVLEIRRLFGAGITRHALSEQFNIGAGNIWLIVKRKTWRHI